MKFFETTARVNVQDRYIAHVEIDKIYKDRSRIERGWHHAIIDAGAAGFWTLLRTTQKELVNASPAPTAWHEFSAPSQDEQVSFIIQYAPKKVSAFSRFFESDEAACEHVRSRVEMMSDADVQILGRQHIEISKKSIAYRAPSAFVQVTGRVADPAAFGDFLCTGIGGSKAFGLGLPIQSNSQLYPLALALAQT